MSSRLLTLAGVFALLSVTSFGGGNVAIPEVHRQAVLVHRWVTEREFAEAFGLSLSAPGPSTLFVLLIGERVAGRAGAAVAVLAMFLPGAVLMTGACAALRRWGSRASVVRLIEATRPVTIGLLFAAVAVVGRATVVDRLTLVVAVGSAAVLSLTRAPAVALLLVAAALGWLIS